MIETLSGFINGSNPLGFIVKTGPVEWDVYASGRSIRAFARKPDVEQRVYTHLIVREDELRIYGFADRTERTLFRSLIAVSGIGPKQAIKMLSHVDSAELGRLIESADVDALSRLPGIGKKTAQKLVLSLQGELVTDDGLGGEPKDSLHELIESLVSMGFDTNAVKDAVSSASASPEIAAFSIREKEQWIFRTALLGLSARDQGGAYGS